MKRIGKWLGIAFLGPTVLVGISGRRISELMGYGAVFRVRDSNTGQRRAVKVLIEPGSETAKQSFHRE